MAGAVRRRSALRAAHARRAGRGRRASGGRGLAAYRPGGGCRVVVARRAGAGAGAGAGADPPPPPQADNMTSDKTEKTDLNNFINSLNNNYLDPH